MITYNNIIMTPLLLRNPCNPYLHSMVKVSHEALLQLVVARETVQDKVRHVSGTVPSKQRPAEVGNAGFGEVLHQLRPVTTSRNK